MTMLAHRALIRLSGEDVRGFLQGLLTNDVAGAAARTGPVWAGLLTPQGKALFDLIVWPAGEDVLLDVEAGRAEALAKRLTLYRLRRAIALAPAEGLAVHWSPDPVDGATPDPRLATLGWRWLALGDGAAVDAAWLSHRLRLGVTEGVAELGDGETLWLECNAGELDGVSYTKGCYVGQENTARMHHRSKVNRRLVVVPLGEPGERTRAAYPELGLMIEHRRVEALGDALRPDWLEDALAID
ncbi:hypothetical protein GCM10011380_19710 [Sphingomonas metalli]|uniref:Folate-binding protein YgfZ n=1 Tax=Sphingomonas metalli TaxID=1779358 RepID=A0A916T3D0_9SPHN|nr:folate-binding protein [Sphingomonas metalli]GGB30297.1 hypothetical protein GCM10011380_19710 [Sphingomonas metalli]